MNLVLPLALGLGGFPHGSHGSHRPSALPAPPRCVGQPESPKEESWCPCFCSLGPTDQEKTGGAIWHWEDAGWARNGREACWGLERSHWGQSLHGARTGVLRSTVHQCSREHSVDQAHGRLTVGVTIPSS